MSTTLTRRELLAAAAGGAALGIVGLGSPAAAARTKNLILNGQRGNLTIITPGGDLLMYYHPGWVYGTPDIVGPFRNGSGWGAYSRLANVGIDRDNLYVAVDSDGVWGYYWNGTGNFWYYDGARQLIAPRSGAWRLTRSVISGGNWSGWGGIFYTIDTDGVLRWHMYIGVPGAGGYWHPNSGRQIGMGWQNFAYVTASVGVFWAVEQDGTLRWYRYDTPIDGSSVSWHPSSTTIVGSGWIGGTYGYQTVLAGGNDVVYAVDRNGLLRYNRHVDYTFGGTGWTHPTDGGRVIGSGWM